MRPTYQQACAANWPRPTCIVCYMPCAYDREFRARSMCQCCYRDEPLIIHRKGLPCLSPP